MIISVEIECANIVIRGVEVEEQNLFRTEPYQLILPHLPNVQSGNPSHLAEPEAFLVNQPAQVGGGSPRVRRAQRLVSPRRSWNRDIDRVARPPPDGLSSDSLRKGMSQATTSVRSVWAE